MLVRPAPPEEGKRGSGAWFCEAKLGLADAAAGETVGVPPLDSSFAALDLLERWLIPLKPDLA
jgi:hypothetical protein